MVAQHRSTVIAAIASASDWPPLPFAEWRDTCATLHLWTQIAGKVRLAQSPWVNHSWHVTLYVAARGLSTGPVPHGSRMFEIEFDFIDHVLRIQASSGEEARLPLVAQSVAAFHRQLMSELKTLGLPVHIHRMPNELPDPIAFDKDEIHRTYDREYAHRFWQVLVQADRVFRIFRARFTGKCSPVHFFWGSADLAVTRFSGRRAPMHPGGIPHLPDWVVRDAYSEEVSSCGFWPGGGGIDEAAFYSYAYPEPSGFATARVQPQAAYYSQALREFVLPYETVRQARSPDEMLLQFLESTYSVAAELGKWDRASLERAPGAVDGPAHRR